ncbi:hypothetical protein ABZV64_13180 [Streptomyces sp. NPDC004959]|uniref:hypothetical protein n=1 Tax=unclassified Streptomyces TaxID=2593676 RepID=UPI000A86C703|nr:hypothetical protein [Streptomyces sp. NRRL F-5630]
MDQRFQAGTERRLAWGIGLLIVAGLCWAWSAWHTFTPYETANGIHCSAPFHREDGELYAATRHSQADDSIEACVVQRNWQSSTVPLVLSFPLAVTGVGLLSGALATRRSHAHRAAMERAEREWERGKGGRA